MAAFTTGPGDSGDDVVRCFVKGAAPAVVARAGCALSAGASVPWDEEIKSTAEGHIQRMEEDGLRVMACGVRDLDRSSFDPDGDLLAYVSDLEITSLVGMVDPPRAQSKQAVHDAQAAHIRVRMVTGDDVVTGAAIAEQLGIEGEAILGAEFAALNESERMERIERIGVVGRVAPEHKVLLAETLKQKGEIVAMTGDGVNDAPSIKAAHIGIAMGSGTEVAKNASRMILTDDNFATIVRAVSRGPEALRQPDEVRPVRPHLARRVRPHLPGRDAAQHRRGSAVHARRRSCGSTSSSARRSASRSAWTRPRPG